MKHYKPSGGKAKKRLLALVLAMALIVGCLLPVYANGVATMDAGNVLDLAPGINETVDKDGNVIITWGKDTWNQWDDEQASSYPEGEQMDPGFAIPTNTYRFWLTNDETKREAADVEIASAMELYDMTAYDATEMYGPLYGMYTLVAIADGGTMSDNTVRNPTSADAPDASKPYFAGWYTLDEFGYEREFLFDSTTVSVAKSATVDVFAKWAAAKSGEAAQPNEDLAAEQTYERWFAQLISCSDSAFNDLIDRYLEDEGFETWLAELPEEELQYLSDRMEPVTALPGGGGSQNEIDISKYSSKVKVYYDTTTLSGKNHVVSTTDRTHIDSVYLNGKKVTQGNSNSTSWSGGMQLSTYYGEASKNNMQDASLRITAEAGYYIAEVVVACTSSGNSRPYSCQTWDADNAYDEGFDLSQSTYENGKYTLNVQLNSKWFCHRSNDSGNSGNRPGGSGGSGGSDSTQAYFILIRVATVPTPLYVEYNYGDIGTLMYNSAVIEDTSSAFYSSTWTVKNSGNAYGTGTVLTNDTQFKYSYNDGQPADVANWKHTANSISSAAAAEAAAAGYYFTGWAATYYNNNSDNNTPKATQKTDIYGNSWTIDFGTDEDKHGTNTYASGATVALTTHVKLVAQWAPIELNVTKTVNGLTGSFLENHSYTLIVQKQTNDRWVDYKTVVLTVNGNKSESETLKPVPAGTYRVIEQEDSKSDLEKTIGNVTTTMYITVNDGEQIVLGANNSGAELKVTNSYSETQVVRTTSVTITKQVTGLIGDTSKDFTFKVKFTKDNETLAEGISGTTTAAGTVSEKLVTKNDDDTFSFTLRHGHGVTFTGVPIGATVTITETDASGYEVSSSITDSATYKEDRADNVEVKFEYTVEAATSDENPNEITVTNHKTLIPDAGVNLGSATPYLFLLCVGAVGVATLRRKRRS